MVKVIVVRRGLIVMRKVRVVLVNKNEVVLVGLVVFKVVESEEVEVRKLFLF